ncbi:hypothetical protein TSAR_000116 [Trichomalopsis sarcophagae]|uniref:Uncharacterized protein n=1 Tax=Trichomalopsis sarcophagae TaxID=543379 RepID=A0A232EDE7_9HYME|nr:hypothetical protein TSAR_000116 [Trichomalopsis sarcophagae]
MVNKCNVDVQIVEGESNLSAQALELEEWAGLKRYGKPVCACIRIRGLSRDYNDMVNKCNVDVHRVEAPVCASIRISRLKRGYNDMVNKCNVDVQRVEAEWV